MWFYIIAFLLGNFFVFDYFARKSGLAWLRYTHYTNTVQSVHKLQLVLLTNRDAALLQVRLGRWPESNLSHGTLRMSHNLILFLVISRDLTSGLEASLYLYVESVKHLFRPTLILFLVIFFVFYIFLLGFSHIITVYMYEYHNVPLLHYQRTWSGFLVHQNTSSALGSNLPTLKVEGRR